MRGCTPIQRSTAQFNGAGYTAHSIATHLHRDDAAGFVVVRLAGLVLVQRVEHRVGLVAEGFSGHGTEVKLEAVQQEVNFDPGPRGLWTHRRGRAQDQGGAAHRAARLVLQPKEERRGA